MANSNEARSDHLSLSHPASPPATRSFDQYPAYKDSGVEWLGQIPVDWDAKRLKFVAAMPIKNGIGEAGAYINPDWPRYVRITDIAGPRDLRQDTFKSLPPELAREAPFGVGDLLLAAVGATYGKSYLHVHDAGPVCFAGYLVRFSPSGEVDPSFAAYWTESSVYWALMRSRVVQTTIQNFSAAKYKELALPLPSMSEQCAISRFLDRETTRIDALVIKKHRLIDLLEEKRTQVVTNAVTRGLNPHTRMKDSGVKWLGDIPAHWEVKRLKHVLEPRKGALKTGPFGSQLQSSEMQAGDVKVYNQRSVINRDFSAGENYVSLEKFAELGAFEAFPGDLLITTRGSIGLCAILPADAERGVLHPCLMRVQPDQSRILTRFMAIQVGECNVVLDQLRFMSNATTIDVIYSGSLREVWLTVPPISEQTAIDAFVTKQTAEFDALIAKVSDIVDRLKELRAALITAAVAGKIDLREDAT